MAPIPAIFSEDTISLVSAAQRHQTDLVEFQIPRLRSCKGPLSLQQNLAAELKEDVDSFARQVEVSNFADKNSVYYNVQDYFRHWTCVLEIKGERGTGRN